MEYHPPANIGMVKDKRWLDHKKKRRWCVHTTDNGEYTFTEADFPRLPDTANLIVWLYRTHYQVLESETGEAYLWLAYAKTTGFARYGAR